MTIVKSHITLVIYTISNQGTLLYHTKIFSIYDHLCVFEAETILVMRILLVFISSGVCLLNLSALGNKLAALFGAIFVSNAQSNKAEFLILAKVDLRSLGLVGVK